MKQDGKHEADLRVRRSEGMASAPPRRCGPGGFVTWMLVAAMGVIGCSPSSDGLDDASATTASAELRFPGSTETIDGLGRAVLEALSRSDTVALAELRLTEREHNDVVWPELPAARPKVNFPIDFAWSNIEMRDRRSLTRLLPVFDGLDAHFRTVQCRGATQTFETFEVLTDCWTIFDVEGREGPFEAQLFKDVLVRGGGHKIFRYYDEMPRRHDPARAG